ncbi:MAG: class I SAM-dependent methyltransferase [Elusimicrobia bacterium]|nr:class I SAM-dependent methyltransferase [Elusimicrobiota bacterium]
MTLKAAPDLLFLLGPSGEWIASNPMTRTHVAASASVLEGIRRTADGHGPDFVEALKGFDEVWVEDRTFFGCRDCTVADATGLELSPRPEARVTGAEAVATALQERFILIDDEAAYRKRFALKTRLLDPEHLGNFHQQMGFELLMRQHKDPEQWWVAQKFEEGLKTVRDNAYRKVQEEFLKRDVPKWALAGKKVLDVGCGAGYYSHLFASFGAEVLGLDQNPEHVSTARNAFRAEGLRFEVFDLSDLESLKRLGGGPFDLIYLSDVLLFYFIPYQPPSTLKGGSHTGRPPVSAASFLGTLKTLLAKGGRVRVLEPHGSFSLCLRYGDPSRPLAVLNEYRRKWFGITPNLQTAAQAFREAGFAVVDIREPVYEGPVRDREDAFLAEYPIWWLFELVPMA